MKPIIASLAAAVLAWSASAAPLQKADVSADAKWLLHLDVQGMLGTKVGDYLGREFLDKHTAKPKADLKAWLDIDFDWRRITSLTAYGTDYGPGAQAKGVLLAYTDMDVRKSLETAMDKFTQSGNDNAIRKTQDGSQTTFTINNDLYVGVQTGKPVLLSKSQEQLRLAREVLDGKGENMTGSKVFASFPPAPNHFFFLVGAQGFNENTPMPPQAKVLKMAEALRLVLGEREDQVFLNVALKAKTQEVSQQIQQVVQGLIALVALGQVENADLQQLAQSTKVTADDKLVVVNIEMSAATAIKKVEEKTQQKRHEESK